MERVTVIGLFLKFLYQVLSGLGWVYDRLIRPVTWPLWRFARYLFRQYRRVWDKAVYKRSGHFSRIRAGGMILATAAAFYVALPVVKFFLDAGLFAVTYGTEEVYLSKSQEIDSANNTHSVTGCESLPCTEANSIYYRVREDTFNSLWSMIHHGGLFYPDYVAAAVPGVSKCTVTSYGFRFKFAMRQWDIYPDMLEAHCQPIFDKPPE
ncbi:MAG: hypothetical protein EOP83_21750 [Verrucomicrobiaceae bacterium]|nr:MAG: hypothetical protein EOP83_21750 [Verrucomicrobiaceae bacterium]